MNIESYREFCLSLPGTSEDMPFDQQTLVFKVGGKMFALTDVDTFASVNLKCDPERAVELRSQYDFVLPGYHMNKKHWNTVQTAPVSEALLRAWTLHSYELVLASLPRKDQQAIRTAGQADAGASF